MTLEKLKELLEKGSITQEEFDEMAKMLETNSKTDPEPDNKKQQELLEKLVQAKVDKAMAQERKEKAELKSKLEKLQKSKLDDDELKKLELEEQERLIEEREKAIADKERRLFAVKAIKEAGLDDGSDSSLALIDFVMADSEDEIKEKIKAFKEVFDKAVSVQVSKRFKDNGRTPGSGSDEGSEINPYAKDTFNLTQQAILERDNPELAAKYKAAAK